MLEGVGDSGGGGSGGEEGEEGKGGGGGSRSCSMIGRLCSGSLTSSY